MLSFQVKPDVRLGDCMDIRQYVHIKKVPGGNRGDCYLVHGAICTKNVANKKVRSRSGQNIFPGIWVNIQISDVFLEKDLNWAFSSLKFSFKCAISLHKQNFLEMRIPNHTFFRRGYYLPLQHDCEVILFYYLLRNKSLNYRVSQKTRHPNSEP